MFGFRKERLLSTMQGLHHLAGTSVFCRYRAIAQVKHGVEGANMRAAALLGSLFGKSADAALASKLDMDEIRGQAQKDLTGDRALRELVVQTLRVEQVLASEGKLPPLGTGSLQCLEAHGSEFPDAPTPQSFERIVHEFISALPESARADVMKQFGVV